MERLGLKLFLLLALLASPAHAGPLPPACAADGAHGLTYSTATSSYACTAITGSGTVPGTPLNSVQYNAASAFTGDASFIYAGNGAVSIGTSVGAHIGTLKLLGSTSGTVTILPQATAGTPTITWGTSTGTPAVTVSAPLALATATGNLTITGVAGQVLAGATPAFTATPTLGASGTLGSLTLGNATSGTITIQTVTGALGTPTISIPAATDTLIGKATTDTLTNKTFNTAGTGNVFQINGTGITAVTGTGAVMLAASPSTTGTLTAAAANFSGNVGIGTATPSAALHIYGGALVTNPTALTIATATFTPVAVNTNTYRVVLIHASCPCTIANPSGTAVDGQRFLLEIWQSATGSDTIGTWGTNYDFGTAGTPTLTATASKGDFIGFSYSAQNSKYNYIGIQQGM